MLGILTEKPSAARNFAKALGGQKGTFDGVDYVIVSACGHLYQWQDISQMVSNNLSAKYKSWDINNLPWNYSEINWKRTASENANSYLREIREALSVCSEIAIATDVDPTGEGDLLACEILQELRLDRIPLTRFCFIDESEKEIPKAFRNRKVIPGIAAHPDYKKALYRSKFDFLTMQFTRAALSASDGVSVLRQGRLKSAMVVIVGDGLKACENYKKYRSIKIVSAMKTATCTRIPQSRNAPAKTLYRKSTEFRLQQKKSPNGGLPHRENCWI
jgi:DNA topoisomerase-3